MSLVTLPSARIPLTIKGDTVSPEFYRWMFDMTERVGGPTGASTPDLVVSQFDDAGIAEQQAESFSLANAIGQIPAMQSRIIAAEADNQRLTAEVEELRGLLYVLTSKIAGIEQATLQ
jgi:hypothetical protein